MPTQFIKQFSDTRLQDLPEVGGKNSSLGEMICRLSARKAEAMRFPFYSINFCV